MTISNRTMWIFISAIFVVNAVIQTVLAWNGSRLSVVCLGVTAVFLAVMCGVYGRGWRSSLEGWGRSTTGWSAAQTWGMKQDEILRDALRELRDVDEEAYEIHSGRSTVASMEYLTTLGKEFE